MKKINYIALGLLVFILVSCPLSVRASDSGSFSDSDTVPKPTIMRTNFKRSIYDTFDLYPSADSETVYDVQLSLNLSYTFGMSVYLRDIAIYYGDNIFVYYDAFDISAASTSHSQSDDVHLYLKGSDLVGKAFRSEIRYMINTEDSFSYSSSLSYNLISCTPVSSDDDAQYQAGYSAGYNEGSSAGYSSGYSAGESAGYESGYQAGVESVDTSESYQLGYNSGYNSGYSSGYSAGYDAGILLADTNNHNWTDVSQSIGSLSFGDSSFEYSVSYDYDFAYSPTSDSRYNCFSSFKGSSPLYLDGSDFISGTYRGFIKVRIPFTFDYSGSYYYSWFVDHVYLHFGINVVEGVFIGSDTYIFNLDDLSLSSSLCPYVSFSGSVFYGRTTGNAMASDYFDYIFVPHLSTYSLYYHKGYTETPSNMDDFNDDESAFNDAVEAGDAIEKDLTDTSFSNLNSATSEYFQTPSANVLSGASFYVTCITGFYDAMGDFKYVIIAGIMFLLLNFIFRKKGG